MNDRLLAEEEELAEEMIIESEFDEDEDAEQRRMMELMQAWSQAER